MQKEVTFTSPVINGKLLPHVGLAVKSTIGSYESKEVDVIVREHECIRTTKQNATYFKFIVPAFQDYFKRLGTPVDAMEIHRMLKKRAGGLTSLIELPDGTIEEVIGKSRRLTTKEWSDYMEQCLAFAASIRCPIELPV